MKAKWWKRLESEDQLLWVFVGVVLFCLVGFGGLVSFTEGRIKKCLSSGYPSYQSGYCTKRVDGTDYVIKVEDLE